MSTGPGEGSGVPAPGPVRSRTLSLLKQELWHARDVGATVYAAELERRIAELSQGSADNPRRETTGRRPAARKQRTA